VYLDMESRKTLSMSGVITDYLRRHGVNPSPKFSEEWARDNWYNWKAVEEHVKEVRGHTKDGKDKGVICKMLGTCLEAAFRDREDRKREIESRRANELLLYVENKQLREQLQEQKEKMQKFEQKVEMMLIQAPQPPDIVQIRKLIVSPEDWDGDIWGGPSDNKLEDDVPSFPTAPPEYEARPIIKTEITTGPRGGNPRNTTRTSPWDPLQLSNLQEKYSRNADETETQYLWRVCLTGGDRIMLSQDEASRHWGPGVILNLGPDPADTPHSITSRVAYWAGGVDILERGEPSLIPIESLSELPTAITKAACIQAMQEKGQHDIPLSATVNFEMLKPLIRGAPATGWDAAALEKQRQKFQGGDQKVRPTKQGTEIKSKGNKNLQTQTRNEAWRKALALGIPRFMIQGRPTGDILWLIERLYFN
uniref:Uncharacterized protein n=1 Tax=Calidris pygmaea TaxID=425635 RepID=A0A8C3K6U7_9CHAR